ncbi:uncharacterized protein LOC114518619 [Dendronephthya gigantea]|uniref:uncharacterized protein LOC114518619 n=1 Tax=Dendronephthya gigantea TaxID=151771 RepID=UPI00106B398D|nr:uncharacterized protein LOC114518619 [Dendronephthya gigantea]
MQSPLLSCMSPVKSTSDEGAPTFSVKYLGQAELEKPGLDDMCTFVRSICESVKKSKQKDVLKGDFILSNENCSFTSSGHDIHDSTLLFRTRRIQFCGVYELNPKIFFFTYQFGKTADVLQCHVLKCRNKKEAKLLAKQAGIMFKDIAFSLNRRLRDTPNYRSPLSSLGSQRSTASSCGV